jgi:ribosomal protein S18 acetylase RimI-like enzyme
MHPLDNIIWNTLTTRHKKFADICGQTRRFPADIGPLAGFPEQSADRYSELAELSGNGTIALFLPEPFEPREGWEIMGGAPLYQMVCRKEDFSPAGSPAPVLMLDTKDSLDMFELTGLTKPGPFGSRTHELGNFFGIRQQGKLAAMGGERMKVPGFTEISAVCTHPDHLGKGYAAAIMSRVAQGIVNAGETPFLHVRHDNPRAIDLYERLGFRKRTTTHYVILKPH